MHTKKELLKEYVTKNIDKLYRLALSYSKTEQYAEDIVNESVARALAAIDTLRNEEYIGTWMYRIIINTANTYLKKQSKIIYLDDTMVEDGVPDRYSDVDLYKEIMKLEDKYRIIIILRFFEDQSIEKIADILSENVNTVKTRLYAGLDKLKKNMGKDVDINENIF
jgi:RNA polymerase sigma-70 factor, ECF subfamily